MDQETAARIDRMEQENESLLHEMRVFTGMLGGATRVARHAILGAVGNSPIARDQMLTLLRDLRVQSHQAVGDLENDHPVDIETVKAIQHGVDTIFDRLKAFANGLVPSGDES